MPPPRPLLEAIRAVIERTYDLDTGLSDLAPFIIGDAGWERFYAGREIAAKVAGSAAGVPARTLLREEGGALRAAIYFPDRLVENLEALDPTRVLSDDNVDDFATFVEELDHFLVIADRHRAGGTMSLLELELHANVTKELTLSLFAARLRGAGRLGAAERAWLRWHLFDKCEWAEEDAEVRERYRDAAALAVRYLDWLARQPAAARPRELRRFHRRTHHEKLAFIHGR